MDISPLLLTRLILTYEAEKWDHTWGDPYRIHVIFRFIYYEVIEFISPVTGVDGEVIE